MERRLYSFEERTDILKKSNRCCAHCGAQLDEYKMSVEHAYPFQKGGEDVYENIVALCYDCNQKKGNATFFPEEYYSYLNDRYLKILSDYVESKCYKRDYPLGDVTRFVYDGSDAAHNVMSRQKNLKDKRILMNRSTSKSYLYAAYPADAEEVLRFMIKAYSYRYKKIYKRKDYKFVPKDRWLAKRAVEDTLKYDRLYVITNSMPSKNKYVEYQAFVAFNRIKDLTITSDPDDALKKIDSEFFLTGYNFYKAPTNALPMFNSIAHYCRENGVFVPILEFCDKTELPVISFKGKDKYHFVTVEFRNTVNPIPEGEGIDYKDTTWFFRIPKCVAYGQPASTELYTDIVNDNYNSDACRYA